MRFRGLQNRAAITPRTTKHLEHALRTNEGAQSAPLFCSCCVRRAFAGSDLLADAGVRTGPGGVSLIPKTCGKKQIGEGIKKFRIIALR